MTAPPPLRTAKLPPRPPFLRALGPGVVWLALAQGSGELIWWPYLIAKYGLWFLCLLIPACLLQWPLNVEIGRYTMLTGESVWQGFYRQSRVLSLGLWLLMAASFLWFGGFASAGGEAIASLTGLPAGLSPEGQKIFWGFASVAVSFVALLFSRTAYTLVERVMMVVAIVTVLGLVASCFHPEVRERLPAFAAGLVAPDPPPGAVFDFGDATRLLTALSFAGLGGFWTLFYSSWLREKGFGMAAYMGKVTSPITGKGEFVEDTGAAPLDEPGLAARVRGWTRLLWADSGVGVFGNILTTLMMCLLSYALLFPHGKVPTDDQLVTLQAQFFESSWGDLGRIVFLVVAAAFLADTWLGTADAVAHTHTEMFRSFSRRLRERYSYRTMYYAFVVALTVVTSLTMAARSPSALILTSAVIGFFGTVLYSAALLHLNYRVLPPLLPPAARPSPRGAVLLGAVVATYAALAVAYVVVELRS